MSQSLRLGLAFLYPLVYNTGATVELPESHLLNIDGCLNAACKEAIPVRGVLLSEKLILHPIRKKRNS